MRFLVPAVALFTLSFILPGKSPVFEGKVVYSISYEELPAEYEAYVSMMPKEMTMYIKNEKARIEQNTGMGTTITIVDKTKNETIILMDMMGMKNAYKGASDEKKDGSTEKPVIKLSSETKTIAGYTCKRADVTTKVDNEEVTNTIWYTDQLPSGLTKGVDGIDGFPMEYSVKASGMTMAMTVKSITAEKVPDSYFTIPDGYSVKSMDELQKMGGK